MKLPILLLTIATILTAQPVKLPVNVEALNSIARESVDVTMDASMIRLAEKFLSEKDPDQVKARRILRGLNAIYVKVFEFDKPGAYSTVDVDQIRDQLKAPGWSRMVQAREGDENVEVFVRTQGGEISGLLVLAAEPREITIVHLDGPVRPEELASLSGRIGLPRLKVGAVR